MYLETRQLFGDGVAGENFTRPAAITRRSRRVFASGVGLLLLLAAIFAAGCSSLDKPASVSFASVVLPKSYSIAKIQQATVKVFQQNGYQNVPRSDNPLVFEREATRGEQISYAGLVGAQGGEKVVIQVQVFTQDKNASSYWLGCKAYAVCNPDQPIYSTTTAMFNFQSGPYQELMDDVKKMLPFPTLYQ